MQHKPLTTDEATQRPVSVTSFARIRAKSTPKRKRARPLGKFPFPPRQADMFMAEKYLAFVLKAFKAAPGEERPQRSEDAPQPGAAPSR